MRVYVEGEDYLRWVEDFENNLMGLGLTERKMEKGVWDCLLLTEGLKCHRFSLGIQDGRRHHRGCRTLRPEMSNHSSMTG